MSVVDVLSCGNVYFIYIFSLFKNYFKNMRKEGQQTCEIENICFIKFGM